MILDQKKPSGEPLCSWCHYFSPFGEMHKKKFAFATYMYNLSFYLSVYISSLSLLSLSMPISFPHLRHLMCAILT